MLSELQLTNFKSFPSQKIPLSQLTLLAGINNTGKSSVVQALKMLQEYQSGRDPALSGHGPLTEVRNGNAPRTDPLIISCAKIDGTHHNLVYVMTEEGPDISGEQTGTLPFMAYLAAERWGPRTILPLSTSSKTLDEVGEHGEFVLDYLSRRELQIVPEALLHPKSEGKTLLFNVRAWLYEISPNVEFKHKSVSAIDHCYAQFNGFRPSNVGFGLSYTLPVIVMLLGAASVNEEIVILLENPEAHLHPQGQTSMGRLLALTASQGVQIIVETHSDHLMDGIRIAVKEKNLDPKDTAFHYFSLDDKKATQIESPKIHPNGKLDYWPKGFFDQTMKNRARLAKKD